MDCPVGPREIIKEGINGILVPLSKNEDENVKNLSLTLQKALEGKIKIGTQMEIRESVMQFMPEKIVKDWKKLLSAN
jgi:glycosyltransferase involved in cell wall biosynthesis